MEHDVITGARATIERLRPAVYIENDRAEHSRALISLLFDIGYRLWWHITPLFNPKNFFGNRRDIFSEIVSFNMIGFPARGRSLTRLSGNSQSRRFRRPAGRPRAANQGHRHGRKQPDGICAEPYREFLGRDGADEPAALLGRDARAAPLRRPEAAVALRIQGLLAARGRRHHPGDLPPDRDLEPHLRRGRRGNRRRMQQRQAPDRGVARRLDRSQSASLQGDRVQLRRLPQRPAPDAAAKPCDGRKHQRTP